MQYTKSFCRHLFVLRRFLASPATNRCEMLKLSMQPQMSCTLKIYPNVVVSLSNLNSDFVCTLNKQKFACRFAYTG